MFNPSPKILPHPYIWMGLMGGPMNPLVYPTFLAYSWYVDWLKAIVNAMEFPDHAGK